MLPSARPLRGSGLVAVVNVPPSRLTSKWLTPLETPPTSGSPPVKVKLADELFVSVDGPDATLAVGGVWSIVVTGPEKLPVSVFSRMLNDGG